MEAVCKALRPPAKSSTPATTPEVMPQKSRNLIGGCSSPMESMVHITKVPESDEVTNQEIKRMVIKMVMGVTWFTYISGVLLQEDLSCTGL